MKNHDATAQAVDRGDAAGEARNYTIDTRDGITAVRFALRPGVVDIRHAIDNLAEDGTMALRLWDLTKSGLSMSSAELRELAAYGKSQFYAQSRVAIVTSDDLAFGLSSMFRVYREDERAKLKVFTSEEDARLWLQATSE